MYAHLLDSRPLTVYDVIKIIFWGGFDNMNTKKIEKAILDELEEEIRELKRQGKLHKIEDAMDHAMEKFTNALKDKAAGVVDALDDDENSLKKNIPPAEEK